MLPRQTVVALATLLLCSSVNAADTYRIDPTYTTITFSFRHLGINSVTGRFKEFAGSLVMDKGTLKDASGTIQVDSLDTGVAERDDHLRGAEFFDAARYPTITFKATRIRAMPVHTRHRLPDGRVTITANFTMHGVTKELRLPAKLTGPVKDPSGKFRIGLEAKTTLKRKDYGINFHQALDAGVLLVGDAVTLEINAEAIKDTAATSTP